MENKTFSEMTHWILQSKIESYENRFMKINDLPLTVQIIMNRVKMRINKGIDPRYDVVCIADKRLISMIYNDLFNTFVK